MIVLHAAPLVWGEISGLNASLLGLVKAQSNVPGCCAAMVATHPRPGSAPAVGFPIFARDTVLRVPERLDLPSPFDRPDLVVFNSTYIPFHARFAAKLRRLGIPYIICPHGNMTRGAQHYKWLKKRLGNLLFFNKLVAHAKAIHCLTVGEAEQTVGWGKPIFVVGNGVCLPPAWQLAAPGRSERLRLAFVGRLDIRHKGLDWLLEACRLAGAELRQRGAEVELWGPDVNGVFPLLAGYIARHRLQDVVRLCGPVLGEAKTALLRQIDVFVHTSRWEGHPMAVLEALAFGLPCLLTPGTNLADDVAAAGAGFRAEPSPEAIAQCLRRILKAPASEIQRAGRQARLLAEREFDWERIAARLMRHYQTYTVPYSARAALHAA